MMAGFDCHRCRPALSAIAFRCWACGRVQHVHRVRWTALHTGNVLDVTCCDCQVENLVAKPPFQPVEGERAPQGVLI